MKFINNSTYSKNTCKINTVCFHICFMLFFQIILLTYKSYAFKLRFPNKPNSHDMIIKFSNHFYDKLEKQNKLQEFKNNILSTLERGDKMRKNRTKFEKYDKFKNFDFEENLKIHKNITTTKISNNRTFKNKIKRKKTDISFDPVDQVFTSSASRGTFRGSYYDIVAKERTVKFYISLNNECNVLINDTIKYNHSNQTLQPIETTPFLNQGLLLSRTDSSNNINHPFNTDTMEHMVLNNNVEFIDPKGVFSNNEKIDINLFVYNKKLNMFTVFYEKNENVTNYSLEYDYMAMNLLKSQRGINSSLFNNTFIWKFYNENIMKEKQILNIEFYFSIDKFFEKENVTFYKNSAQFNLEKNVLSDGLVKYSKTLDLYPSEVFILDVKFPMYFENCGVMKIDISMIIIGSIFIFFLIFVLYIMLSQILKVEDY